MIDCETPQYYIAKEPIARKVHECCECDAPILVGEKYTQVNACWDGQPTVYRQHDLCAKACELVRDAGLNDGDCLMFTGLKEWWRESRYECVHPSDFKKRKELWFLMLHISRRERKSAKPEAGTDTEDVK